MSSRRALTGFALLAGIAIVWLAHPFATGLLFGALLAFTLEPAVRWLERRTGLPVLARVIAVVLTGVVIVAALSGLASLVVAQAVEVFGTARTQLQQGGALSGWVARFAGWMGGLGVPAGSLTERLESAAADLAQWFAALAPQLATATFAILLGLFFALLAMYYVLRSWPRMVDTLVEYAPLRPQHTRLLLSEFRRVGRMTVSGTAITGLAQGVLAAIGFAATGVPQALFFGTATAAASLLPGVGTMLVWAPAGLWLYATGHPVGAIAEWVWGALVVVGFSDYVIRPRLVGDDHMPALLVFLSLFGGIEVMGLSGLIVGPVVMALAVAVLKIYARDTKMHG